MAVTTPTDIVRIESMIALGNRCIMFLGTEMTTGPVTNTLSRIAHQQLSARYVPKSLTAPQWQ